MSSGVRPIASRPKMSGGVAEPVLLPWSWALDRLSHARNYWIATTRPDGRPHTRPVWGVLIDEAVFFSTGSLAVANLARSPEISLHTESATELVILEGVATVEIDRSVIVRVCDDYSAKYDEALDADHLPGPFYRTRPRVAFGWLATPSFIDGGAVFHGTATKWTFAGEA